MAKQTIEVVFCWSAVFVVIVYPNRTPSRAIKHREIKIFSLLVNL